MTVARARLAHTRRDVNDGAAGALSVPLTQTIERRGKETTVKDCREIDEQNSAAEKARIEYCRTARFPELKPIPVGHRQATSDSTTAKFQLLHACNVSIALGWQTAGWIGLIISHIPALFLLYRCHPSSQPDVPQPSATRSLTQPMNSPTQNHRTPTHHSHSNSLSGPSSHSHTITFASTEDDVAAPLLIKSPTSPMPASSPPASSISLSSATGGAAQTNASGATLPSATTAPPPSWFRRRIIIPLFDILKSGATPEGIALSLAFGLTGGVFPVPAITTVACIVLAYVFSLNFPAVQLTNLLMTPVNLATFIPFIRAGEWLLGVDGVELSGVVGMLRSDPLEAVRVFWVSLVRGVLAWLAFLPVATWLAYVILRPIIRRVMGNMKFT